jgi:hypothetical protein
VQKNGHGLTIIWVILLWSKVYNVFRCALDPMVIL